MLLKRFFNWVLLIALLFIYLSSLVFNVLPINTKIILEAIGLLISFIYFFDSSFQLKKKYRWIISFALVIIVWDLLVCLVNNDTNVFYLTKAMVTPLGSIFGAQFIYLCARKTINTTDKFFIIVSLTVFIECLLTLCIHFIPGADSFYTSIFVPSGGAADLSDIAGHYRLVGIGNAVAFGALPSFALGLYSAFYIIACSKKSLITISEFLIFATIILVTFLVVRTSIAVSAISLLALLIFGNKKKATLFWGILTLSVFSILAFYLISEYVDTAMMEWAFGFMVSKDMDTGSQGAVIEWWKTTSFDFKTFILGDGLYENASGGYYGGTDIGYFRQIYYGGIIGLAFMLYYHFRILKFAYLCNKSSLMKAVAYLLFISFLIFLAKGDLNMLSGFILLLVFLDNGIFEKKQKSHNSKYK